MLSAVGAVLMCVGFGCVLAGSVEGLFLIAAGLWLTLMDDDALGG